MHMFAVRGCGIGHRTESCATAVLQRAGERELATQNVHELSRQVQAQPGPVPLGSKSPASSGELVVNERLLVFRNARSGVTDRDVQILPHLLNSNAHLRRHFVRHVFFAHRKLHCVANQIHENMQPQAAIAYDGQVRQALHFEGKTGLALATVHSDT